MGTKKRRGKIKDAVSVNLCSDQFLAGVGKELAEAVTKFLEAQDVNQQMGALKQVVTHLKESEETHIECYHGVLQLVAEVYFCCPSKNPLKKAVACNIQGLPERYQPLVCAVFSTRLSQCMDQTNDHISTRAAVDHVVAMTENFSLGENIVLSSYRQVFEFLAKALDFFFKAASDSSSPVDLTQRMHDCHVTLQVFAKLLQKSGDHLRQDVTSDGHLVHAPLSQCFDKAVKILADEQFMLDCRGTSGLVIPLMLLVYFRDQAQLTAVLQTVFGLEDKNAKPCYNNNNWLSSKFIHTKVLSRSNIPVTSFLCICAGFLAMMELSMLSQSLEQGESILLYIARVILSSVPSLGDTSSKLIASRALVLLTNKMSAALVNGHVPERMKMSYHGDAEVPQQLLQYSWTHWQDSVDNIRHQARTIFASIIQCHLLASGEDAKNSHFLLSLAKSLLSMDKYMKGRYGPLASVVEQLGASCMLDLQPLLPAELLQVVNEQSLACHVCELYEVLFIKHHEELSTNQNKSSQQQWESTWVDPLTECLRSGSPQQRYFVIEHVLPRLFKKYPATLTYMIQQLSRSSAGTSHESLGALITCLKRGRALGIIQTQQQAESDETGVMWNGVVPVSVLQRALCHQDDQVRLDAFGLLCENSKRTEAVSAIDLELLKLFFTFNMNSQEPAFRQLMVSYAKKIYMRLDEGGQALERQRKNALKQRSPSAKEFEDHLKSYKDFLDWLFELLFSQLHPAAAFPSRTTSLSLLGMMLNIMGCQERDDQSLLFSIPVAMTTDRIQTLLECFTDTFETNKIEVYNFLTKLPIHCLVMEDDSYLCGLLDASLELACSTKPQDCTTAAYLLRLLVHIPHTYTLLNSRLAVKSNLAAENSWSNRSLVTLQILVKELKEQILVASKSILHTAATKPMYPTLHCIRYLITDVKLSEVKSDIRWDQLISDIITICQRVAEIVSPIVSNSSPEGNVPEDSILGPGLTLDAVVQSEEERELLKGADESAKTVSLMPEYLVVCCWRSIKEVSLLLGQLAQTTPITDPQHPENGGLVSIDELKSVCQFFIKQLLESRHRGAFELASAGFVKMADMLWRCPLQELNSLPRQLIQNIMTDIRSDTEESKLCATRRSAGVPFYIQALVTTEPAQTGRRNFKWLMEELLLLTKEDDTTSQGLESLPKVHALNILRALYRDTRLGDDVFPFIAGGMKAAISGFASQTWLIRNSSTLLFSALVTRIFGVKRSKDDLSRKNCMTGRVFFHRFPSLYQFLLDQIDEATKDLGGRGHLHLHPGLYPTLLVLGRLFPSVIEGMDTSLNLAAFIPYVIRCACSPVFKTRLMAARAIQPLVCKDQITSVLSELLSLLPKSPDQGVPQNFIHGVILQIHHLLNELPHLPASIRDEVEDLLVNGMKDVLWLSSRKNICPVTRTAFVEMITTLISLKWTKSPENENLKAMLESVTQVCLEELSCDISICHDPCAVQLKESCVKFILHSIKLNSDLSFSDQLEKVLHLCLRSPCYEVQLAALQFMEEESDDVHNLKLYNLKPAVENKHLKLVTSVIEDSDNIFHTLVSMVTSDQHKQVSTQAMGVLLNNRKVTAFPWKSVTAETFSPVQVAKHLLDLATSTSRDEESCAAFRLLSKTLPSLYKLCQQEASDQVKDLLDRTVDWMRQKCNTEESFSQHITCAEIIGENAVLLLQNPDDILGKKTFEVWTSLLQLLLDEDQEVREAATSAVQQLKHLMSPAAQDLCCGPVTAPLAVELLMLLLVTIHGSRSGCLDTILSWVLEDLEPDWRGQRVEERLFDKGEMNTYREEVGVAHLAVRYLRFHLQAAITTSPGENTAATDSSETGAADADSQATVAAAAPGLGCDDKSLRIPAYQHQDSRCMPLFTDWLHCITHRSVPSEIDASPEIDKETNKDSGMPAGYEMYTTPHREKTSSGHQGLDSAVTDRGSSPVNRVIKQNLEVILQRFLGYLKHLAPLSHTRPFLNTLDFQAEQVHLFRFLSAICCLEQALAPCHQSHLTEDVRVQVCQKLTRTGATNTLMTHVLSHFLHGDCIENVNQTT